MPREGPGDDLSTSRAFRVLKGNLPVKPRILDIGCGPGAQTFELARISGGSITAVDIHQPYLDSLNRKAAEEGFSRLIKTVNASMFSLPFDKCSFDLIWSEGAIYIIGFERGLQKWRRLLKCKGCVVVSELSWFTENPPEEAARFWEKNHPEMRTVEGNIEIIRKMGYVFEGSLVIPEKSWWENYYSPIAAKIDLMKIKYKDNKRFLEKLESEKEEIKLYRSYCEYFGYVFYCMSI